MKKYFYIVIFSLVLALFFPALAESKGKVKGQLIEDITDEVSLISFALYIPEKTDSKDLVFVFHGSGESDEDCSGLPLYTYLKYGYCEQNAYVCFLKKDKGSWAQYDREALSTFFQRVIELVSAKNVHYIGYSQGAYDAYYVSGCYKSWKNVLLIDGGGDTSWVKDKFKHSIWIAGFDEKSYDKAEDFDEYYEPLDIETFTSKRKYHYASAVFAFADKEVIDFYDKEYADYYDIPFLDGFSKVLQEY